jgi:DsbE subfamily thiol:disulfide oxidoreductase
MRIYRLARTLYYDDLLHDNITYWADGDLGDDPTIRSSGMIKRPLPNFNLARLIGTGSVANADLPAPYLINFWASWCPPCREEFPLLIKSINDGSLGMPILFVNVADTRTRAQQFVGQISFPDDSALVIDSEQAALSVRLGVTSIPQTFLIDAHGTIQAIRVGGINTTALAFLEEIARHPGVGTFDANAPSCTPSGNC